MDRENCLKLISSSTVMTLATQSRGRPWSAPVYYLFTDPEFYFFSSPDSRHVKEGENQYCGASIFRDAPCFENLEGIQMAGRIEPAPRDAETMKIAWAYCRRHGVKIPGGTDPASQSGEILKIFASAFHARFYFFEPELIFYMDNTRGFGTRIKVEL